MRVRAFLLSSGILAVQAVGLQARSPDDPEAAVPPSQYGAVSSGTKSYRPVEPLPWGDVNRRVAPQADRPSRPQAPSGAPAAKGRAPSQEAPHHRH
jgi:hypothetical protein